MHMAWWKRLAAPISGPTLKLSDEELYEQGYNRVYDTLEPEQNLDDVEEVMSQVLENWTITSDVLVQAESSIGAALGEAG